MQSRKLQNVCSCGARFHLSGEDGFQVWGLGLGFEVTGSVSRVQGLGFRAEGFCLRALGFRVVGFRGLEFGVEQRMKACV